MKKRATKIFIRGLFYSFLIIGVFITVGIFGYRAVMHVFWGPDTEAIQAFVQEDEIIKITQARIDDVSKNLIYCVNEDTGKINKVLLEIFNCEEKKMQYITIPIRTQFTMSDSLYQKLILLDPAIPQVFRLSSITKYFEQSSVYDYGVLVMQDLLGISISYYTAVPESIYETIFTTEILNENKLKIIPKEVFAEEFMDFILDLKTEEDLRSYIEEVYPFVQSNLSLFGKMNYLESYCNTPQSNISFELIAGEDRNNGFVVDKESAILQIDRYN